MITQEQKERCEALVRALRAQMPQDFQWDFLVPFKQDKCGSVGCAMGLAQVMWPEAEILPVRGDLRAASNRTFERSREAWFGMSPKVQSQIFWGEHRSYRHGEEDEEIRPGEVADLIELWLAGGLGDVGASGEASP